MGLPFWLSVGTGGVLMAGHAAIRVLTHYFALDRSNQQAFLALELGSLGVRMLLVFGTVTGVLLYAPVRPAAFVGTVLVLIVVNMILEVRFILQRPDSPSL